MQLVFHVFMLIIFICSPVNHNLALYATLLAKLRISPSFYLSSLWLLIYKYTRPSLSQNNR